MIKMKIGIFTDSHYSSAELTCGKRYNSRSLGKIKEAMTYFEKEKCNLAICLGDLIDHEDSKAKVIHNLSQIAEVFHAAPFRTFVLMGNHDGFSLTEDEFYSVLGESSRPVSINTEESRLIFVDACYYDTGVHYSPELSSDWTNTFFPHTEWLKKELDAAEKSACLFMHQNIDPAVRKDHCLHNAEEIRNVLELSGKVKNVYQGHYHPGNKNYQNGVSYVTFPAMCELDGARFIIEI